jgi:hypothetical protein
VEALKRGSSKNVAFEPAKLGNFDGVWDQKVINVWFTKMEEFFHVAKVGRHLAVELVKSYLNGSVSTWWRTVRQKEG